MSTTVPKQNATIMERQVTPFFLFPESWLCCGLSSWIPATGLLGFLSLTTHMMVDSLVLATKMVSLFLVKTDGLQLGFSEMIDDAGKDVFVVKEGAADG
jgi:hypothetical protein